MFTDLPEAELRTYRSAQHDPADFDEFWDGTLAASRELDLDLRIEKIATGLVTIDTFDITFNGFSGQPVKAWLRLPKNAQDALPGFVQFVGYGGGRGHAHENLAWSAAGFAHLVMDTRGQGSVWGGGGATSDDAWSGPQIPGFMTRGIDSRESYYYRRVITDAVRAVEVARSLGCIDESRVAIGGTSQGGGIALAVAGLVDGLVAVIPRVPFLCDFPRATVITDNIPYKEIGAYLATHRGSAERVHETLAYFDGVNFARRATAPAWFSTALMDATCPPSTVFAAFNNYAGPKQMTVWPYNGHEGGAVYDDAAGIEVLQEVFSR